MKTLILYQTKHGFTESCARFIAKKMTDVTLEKIETPLIDVENYDRIMIGAPIYKGEIEEFTKEFIKNHKVALLKRKLGIFCSGLAKEEFSLAVQNSLPAEVFYHATIVHCGGVVKMHELSILEKLTLRRRLGITKTVEEPMYKNLDELL